MSNNSILESKSTQNMVKNWTSSSSGGATGDFFENNTCFKCLFEHENLECSVRSRVLDIQVVFQQITGDAH